MAEVTTVDTWIYGTLSVDAGLLALVSTRIYLDVAPEGASFPFVVFQLQTPERDLVTLGARRVWSTGMWLVRGVDKATSFTTLKSIEARIDALLHGVSGSVTGGTVYESVREMPFRLTEVVDRVRYLHLGGIYRIRAK